MSAQLVQIHDGKAKTTSLIVAEVFSKEHRNVLRSIQNLDCSEDFNRLNFEPISYTDSMARDKPAYNMTKDGFTFLVMGYTGAKAMEFKERYITEFNRMEAALHQATALPSPVQSALADFGAMATYLKLPEHFTQIQAVEYVKRKTGKDFSNLLAPEVEVMLEPTELGKRFGISAKAMNLKLESLGLQVETAWGWRPSILGESMCAVHSWKEGFSAGYNLEWNLVKVKKLM